MVSRIKQYPYKATFEKPITYQYSKFLGFGLIKVYESSRTTSLKSLMLRMSNDEIRKPIPNFLRKFKSNKFASNSLNQLIGKNCIDKQDLLLLLFSQYVYKHKKSSNATIYRLLTKLIKRFEVSRNICQTNKDNLSCHILLASNLAVFYQHSGNIKFLNTLLKLNDILCSIPNKLTKDYAALLYFSINTELEEIRRIFNKKGLRL